MNIVELFLVSVGLSMDAFAISICKGMSIRKERLKNSLFIAFFFGGFQSLMPILGYFLGKISGRFLMFNKIIAFVLLLFVGAKMLFDSVKKEDRVCDVDIVKLALKEIILLAVATSVDAFTVGVSLALLNTDIMFSAGIIGIITFGICFAGAMIGNGFNRIFRGKSEIFGAIILILIAIKIVLT